MQNYFKNITNINISEFFTNIYKLWYGILPYTRAHMYAPTGTLVKQERERERKRRALTIFSLSLFHVEFSRGNRGAETSREHETRRIYVIFLGLFFVKKFEKKFFAFIVPSSRTGAGSWNSGVFVPTLWVEFLLSLGGVSRQGRKPAYLSHPTTRRVYITVDQRRAEKIPRDDLDERGRRRRP